MSSIRKGEAIFLPASGRRIGSNVGLVQYGGYYWSATELNSYYAYFLYFTSGGADMLDSYRSRGLSVRLVKDL